jgi:hypothetical protein
MPGVIKLPRLSLDLRPDNHDRRRKLDRRSVLPSEMAASGNAVGVSG